MSANEAVTKAMALAEKGLDYDSKNGANCPMCGKRAKVVTTKPWKDGVRVRYHLCGNMQCIMSVLDLQLKSVEVK